MIVMIDSFCVKCNYVIKIFDTQVSQHRHDKLKCYSQILNGGSTNNFRFWLLKYFVLVWWQTDKKTRNPEAELQGPVYFDRTANCLITYRI